MVTAVTVRPLQTLEVTAVCDLALRVFDKHVAPQFTDEGVAEFHDYAQPDELSERLRSDHFVLVALSDGEIVGMAEVRAGSHISMLFVDGLHQGLGVGGALMRRALERCREMRPGLSAVTVHSSLNAVGFYERFDFERQGLPETSRGIAYVPMELSL